MHSKIYQDDDGVVCFDRYFEYLQQVKGAMPPQLATFALDPGRYELTGSHTLHDSRLLRFSITKSYSQSDEVHTAVELELSLRSTNQAIALSYSGVEKVVSELNSNRWPNSPVDLLYHEFGVLPDGRFEHVLIFDRAVRLEMLFQSFSYRSS